MHFKLFWKKNIDHLISTKKEINAIFFISKFILKTKIINNNETIIFKFYFSIRIKKIDVDL